MLGHVVPNVPPPRPPESDGVGVPHVGSAGTAVVCRPMLLTRVLVGTLGVGFLGLSIYLAGATIVLLEEEGAWGFASAAMLGGLGLYGVRLAAVCVRVDARVVRIRNVLATYRIPVQDVARFEIALGHAGTRGHAVLRSGETIAATALFKNQLLHASGRRTRADRMVDALNAALVG